MGISEEAIQLSEERKRVKQEKLNDPTKRTRYNFLNREIKRKTKGCKDKWMKDLCSKVDKAHQAAKSKEVYSSIKKITRKTSIKMQTVKSKDGHILTEMNNVKHKWKENYEELYNHQNPVSEDFASQLPQMPSMDPEPQILRKYQVQSNIWQMRKLRDLTV